MADPTISGRQGDESGVIASIFHLLLASKLSHAKMTFPTRIGGSAKLKGRLMPVRIDTRQPAKLTLILSLLIVILAIVGHFTRIPYVTQYNLWVAVAGYALLLFATLF